MKINSYHKMQTDSQATFQDHSFIADLYEGRLSFEEGAARVWEYQVRHNHIMKTFSEKLGWEGPISMPIEFFKYREMKSGNWEASTIFESSGTSGQQPSRHYVRKLDLYQESVLRGFSHSFPDRRYRILALLPNYLERGGSSLVHMVKVWMDTFGLPGSDFYLYDFEALRKAIAQGEESGQPILLIGVAFALLDFAQEKPLSLPPQSLVIETGGMKGRKKEMIRSELHEALQSDLGVERIYSEYGMTEMMSQAYTRPNGRFVPPPTLRVWTSDFHLQKLKSPFGVSGRLHLIDLANVHSCSFIATDDIGRVYEDGSFEVLGRIDTAEMRGCNLMYIG